MRQNGFVHLIILIAAAVALVGYFIYKTRITNIAPNLNQTVNFTSTPEPFSNISQPEISGWEIYTDHAEGLFSFEYPSFMNEPSVIPGESRYTSTYVWQVDKNPSGNYQHLIDLQIFGPYPNSTDMDLIDWIKSQYWPHKEGITQEMAGTSKITYITVESQEMVKSVFTETNAKYPRDWILYFKTNKGTYRISLSLQGTEEELSKYQTIFDHMLNTFKFSQ